MTAFLTSTPRTDHAGTRNFSWIRAMVSIGIGSAGLISGCATPSVRESEASLARNFNGVILAENNGELVSFRAYGQASSDVPNTTRHRFRIGSVTKTFISAMIARLDEQGRLEIDDPLSKYLPDFPGSNIVTLRQLVDHSSGVGDLTQADFQTLALAEGPFALEEVIELLSHKPARSRPGAKKVYSNAGYILLGAVIERISGKDWNVAIQDEFLTPLGMNDTGFAAFDADVDGLAAGHAPGMKIDERIYNYSGFAPAGGMYSTAEDLRTWAGALETIGPPWYQDEWLGWTSGERYARKAVWHTGNTNTYSALMVRFPGSDSCYIALSNEAGRGGIPHGVRELARAVFEAHADE